MFEVGVPSGPLQQGDIIRMIPVPYLQDMNEKIVYIGKEIKDWEGLESTPPKAASCDDGRNKAIFIPTKTANVIILSQCCDLEDIERGEGGRIIVAPLVEDANDPHITTHLQEQREGFTEDLGKKVMAAAVLGDQNSEDKAKKAIGTFAHKREEYLKSVWLGQMEGTFPVGASEGGTFTVRRSICYFANLVSLPASWYSLLKDRRMLRPLPHWRAILQEGLARYFARFAYPGSLDERLNVGGIGAKDAGAKDAGTKDVAKDSGPKNVATKDEKGG